jgi:hypothetical protein
MRFDKVFVDKTSEESALVPADDQVVNVQVTECAQIVRYVSTAHCKARKMMKENEQKLNFFFNTDCHRIQRLS